MKAKNMKKITALVMSSAMIMSIGWGGISSAAVLTATEESPEQDVGINGRVEYGTDNKLEVVSVDMVYGAMKFVYTENGHKTGVWNPKTHEYDDVWESEEPEEDSTDVNGEDANLEATKKWWVEDDSNHITLTNHSNVDITTSITSHFYDTSIFGSVSVITVADEQHTNGKLDNGENYTWANADALTYTVTLSGKPSGFSSSEYQEIGSLTVKVAKAS